MKGLSKESATWHEVVDDAAGQRLDNYLIRRLKGVPKSHIYRILRSGEVRVNSRRAAPEYRVRAGDRLRLPPIRTASPRSVRSAPAPTRLGADVVFEDDWLLVINKPAGVAVHGGSGISRGVVEQLRLEHPEARFLELAHRIDRETSGLLMLAKKRAALTSLHRQLREGRVAKHYLALVVGTWSETRRNVNLPLRKTVLASGERRVRVAHDGLPSRTVFTLRRSWKDYSLIEAQLKTGRTHQIRVHLAHIGYPIAGDDKYGDFGLNRRLAKQGLKRMFLHAYRVEIVHPRDGTALPLEAPLPAELRTFLASLDMTDGRCPQDETARTGSPARVE